MTANIGCYDPDAEDRFMGLVQGKNGEVRPEQFVGGPLSGTGSYADAVPTMPEKIARACDGLKSLLLAKNQAHSRGQGFTNVRMFSKADTVERINSRLDDKLSRYVADGWSLELIDDFLGYLMLQRIELVDQGATE